MVKTINNNDIILIDPDEEIKIVAELFFNMNAFVSIKTAEIATTLDKVTQYRMSKDGVFPRLVVLNHHKRRKAYRLNDLARWLENPLDYKQSN